MPAAQSPMIVVVAAVIRDEAGLILLTRRPEGVHMAGLWEFPGGKVESGEAPVAALKRELEEELGLEAVIKDPVTFALHEEPGKRILLLFFEVAMGETPPRAREGQQMAWVAPADLGSYPAPPADRGLIRRLKERDRVDRDPGRNLP